MILHLVVVMEVLSMAFLRFLKKLLMVSFFGGLGGCVFFSCDVIVLV